jgi:hypothetical protein
VRLNEHRAGSPLRVFHLPWNLGGHAAGLAAAERELGLDSRSIAFEPGRFEFNADETLSAPGQSAIARERLRWRLLDRALREADVVHFNWGESLFTPPSPDFWKHQSGPLRSRVAMGIVGAVRGLFAFHDLATLREAGKIIAVTFQGDDIRQGDVQRARYSHSLADVVAPGYYTTATDRWKRRRIAAFAKYAHLIYALNPDLLHVLPARARFLPYASTDSRAVAPIGTFHSQPRIAHAPSDRRVKGSDLIIGAIETLRAGGHDIELDLVENLPHQDARARYGRADLVIDQLHAGFYGGVAVEAMALGRPALAFLRNDDLVFLPLAMREALPVLNVTPASLTDVLSKLLAEGSAGLARRGAACRAFVEAWHDPRVVAMQTKQDYEAAIVGR